jgi:glycosyltransferase involved in cell wall biosynthesis
MKNKLKIVYVSIEDSDDIKAWSGTIYAIKNSLINTNRAEIIVIDKLQTRPSLLNYFEKIISKITGKYVDLKRTKPVLKHYAKEIKERLPKDYDCVIAPSSIPITYLKIDKPIYFYTDATFHSMLDYYFPVNNWSRKSVSLGNYHEQLAIKNSKMVFYASEWAKKDAVEFYNTDPEKIKVVLFGANTTYRISENKLQKIINNRIQNDTIRLLFVGVDWNRKGAEIVVNTSRLLIQSGKNVQLDMVGISNLPLKQIPTFIKNHGFINKNNTLEQEKLNKLYLEADFLFVPSKQECLGIVFAEANTFALPSISTNTGGIPSVVINGVNGYTLDLADNATKYKDLILELVSNKEKYTKLALNAYQKGNTASNWSIIGNTIVDELEKNSI